MGTELKLETVVIRRSPRMGAEAFNYRYQRFDLPGFDPRGGPTASPSDIELIAKTREAFGSIETSVETLSSAERRELESDPSLTSLPQMPFQLVKPRSTSGDSAIPESGNASWGIEKVGANGLDAEAGRGVTVAVLDTGIDPDHPAFSGVKLNRRNFTSEGDDDTDGHGTHCAGTIFGRDVDGVRIGVARGVDTALIGKVLGTGGGATQTILDGVHWALSNGANVISMSLGIDFPGYRDRLAAMGLNSKEATSIALSAFLENVRAFDRLGYLTGTSGAGLRSALVVGAVGNDSDREAFTIACAPPANGEGFLSVAAIDQNERVAHFSNTDPFIAAPGVDVVSAKAGGGLKAMSGTSMAAPHVAGLACTLFAANSGVLPSDVMYRLRQNAKPLEDSQKDVGFGLASY